MSSSDPIRRFHEGRVTLPAGYVDRTVNVFAPNDDRAASINISRDTLQPTETLSAYIDRQVQLLAQHLKGWRSDARQPVALGQTVQGECVPASYLRDGKRIWQQQAVFALTDGSVLVFTQSKNDRLSDADNALFHALLGSFIPADHQ
ncbi:DcrB-related protein [Brenneria tiliae]|uniref:DUF1795 domain-containing protein n=1 Tax=Brenneria tiliae TaxID=2914984 RepID=A0ABT0MQU0_9GAMM|nr:DUF1795 domain-containing protein [Brenneria tiliae]MCL2892224.1 DUF1795 domain-containing protein [Brenneria tiliae]